MEGREIIPEVGRRRYTYTGLVCIAREVNSSPLPQGRQSNHFCNKDYKGLEIQEGMIKKTVRMCKWKWRLMSKHRARRNGAPECGNPVSSSCTSTA
jgi:hypothetical protein